MTDEERGPEQRDGNQRDGEQSGTSLSRALSRPVRAMSRILAGNGGQPVPSGAAPRSGSAIVDCGLYLDGVRQEGHWHFAEAVATARQHSNGFVWLGLKEPHHEELTEIAEVFGLHELAVEDAVKSRQRPKVERYGDMTFMTMRTARYVEHDQLTESSEIVETGDVLMFLGDRFIITVRHGDASALRPVRSQLEQRRELLSLGPWAVAYVVYDAIVDHLIEVAQAIEEDVATIEDSVFSTARGHSSGGGRIRRIYQMKRELMEFKRAVLPLQRPLASLLGPQVAPMPKEIKKYFRDVNDHLTRTVEQVMYFDDVLNSILQARLAQVTVDQNNDMRKIAAWAGIAAVWTALAGIYGMNFDIMPELHWTYGYPAVVALMVGISIALYRAFRRSGWL